ncbi:hypothetical protein [Tenacibaculum dicentrarchi]|uniref:hypothetical protein n=1 Tax=Tenacibaculum dicentrarchi TaxID=669041 RepID=UPI00351844CF
MKGFRLRWSRKEKDWLFEYNDKEGKSLMSLFFDMLKIEENIPWIKKKFVNGDYESNPIKVGGYVDIPKEDRKTLKDMLTERGYDYKTLRITCKRLTDS